MIKTYSKHIAILLAAGCFLYFSLSAEAAVVYKGLGQLEPGQAFWPEGNSIGTGKLKFFPQLTVGVVSNDNIFLDENDEESDVIIHVIPRLMIDYSLEERGSIRLGYVGNFAFYSDFSDNDWEKHDIGFQLDYNAPSGLFLDVKNDYVNTSDPFGSQDEYALGQQKDRWYNLFGVGLGYNHDDRLKIVGYFNFNKQEYDDKDVDYSQNFDETRYGVGLEKRIAQKTWGFARYYYGERAYKNDSPDETENSSNDADYSNDQVFLGLTWDAMSMITGELSFGYEWREYDNSVDPGGKPYKDEDTWLAATRINYSLKPGVTDLHVNLERGTYNRGSNTSERYDGTYFDVFLRHRFYSWYKLLVNFGIGNNDYNDERSDDDYRAGIGLEYLIHRRWTLGIGYDYYRRNSNEPGESWTNNRGMIALTLKY
jgi:hypothetical protein